MRRNFQFLILVLISVTLAIGFAECALYVACLTGLVPIETPTYDWNCIRSRIDPLLATHVRDNNPYFGTWHIPNSKFIHEKSCFNVQYVFNSVGARDIERAARSSSPRAVFLGDSFVEGYGIPLEARLSNLIETWAKTEILNFGVAGHVGTAQYWLIYKHLASSFDHNVVMVGVLPDNDFFDNNYVYGLQHHKHRYRPYLVGKYPNYDLVYYNEPPNKDFNTISSDCSLALRFRQWLNCFSNLYRTSSFIANIYSDLFRQYSGYYDFSEDDWEKMRYTVEQLCSAAKEKDRSVVIILLPVLRDIIRYKKVGPSPLAHRFEKLSSLRGFAFVDLLPAFVERCPSSVTDCQGLYLKCDGHWSSEGNRVAFEALKPTLSKIMIR